jgi:hypothetical protein
MKLTKSNYTVIAICTLIAVGVVWASNNVDAVEDVIG